MKHFSKWIAAVLLLTLSTGLLHASAKERIPEEPSQLYAQSAVLMDADSGRVLFEKNGYEKRPMASTTKIMTLIVTLENANLNEIAEVSDYAAGMPNVQLHIRTGEKYRLEDLLYSLMLESHNDSAVAIAEHVGGSVEGFAAMMNAKARDIGCFDTYFITPNGLDATDEKGTHSTTAADLARILKYCIADSPKKEEFLRITRTPSYSFSDTEGLRTFSVSNKNAFLNQMEGALSGKTGFTGNAGYCYVGSLKRDNRTFIVALLACGWPNHKSWKWSDTRKLMTYGLENYTYQDVFQKDMTLPDILVKEGIPESGDLQAEAFVKTALNTNGADSLPMLLRKDETVSAVLKMKDSLTAPVTEGTPAGSLQYLLGDQIIKTYPVITTGAVEKISLRWCFLQLLGQFLLS